MKQKLYYNPNDKEEYHKTIYKHADDCIFTAENSYDRAYLDLNDYMLKHISIAVLL